MMQSTGGCVSNADDGVETVQKLAECVAVMEQAPDENVNLAIVNDRHDHYRGTGERRLRDEALYGYKLSDKSDTSSTDYSPAISTWKDFRIFSSFFLSFTFGVILPIIQLVIGGTYFGSCNDGNTFSVFLMLGGMLDIAGSSTFTGLVQRIMEKEELSRDPQTEWSKRIWTLICAVAVITWIVIGELKIYNLTHNVNPFRRGLPCVQENGLAFYTQIFLVIKLIAIALGLSLGIIHLFLRQEGRLCWRKYSLKKKPSV